MSSVPDIARDVYDEPTADLTLELPAAQSGAAQAQTFPSSSKASPAMATPAVPPAPGTVLRGRYELKEIIGRGGTSIVYRARDLKRGADIALKMLKPGAHARPEAIERLKKEFQLAQAIAHPSTVRIHDLDRDDADGGERWFMTMELLEGSSLAALMRSGAPIDAVRARQILLACGEALAFAHERGIVHGDFKPGNVFLTRANQVRVLDFGNASGAQADDAQKRAATACYASPEVLLGMRPERRDDVFSFACVAYELFNARHPFDRRPALEARSAKLQPPRAWTLRDRQWLALEAALSFDRERRPAMRTLLHEILSAGDAAGNIAPAVAAARVTRTEIPLVAEPIRAGREDLDSPPKQGGDKVLLAMLILLIVVGVPFAWQRWGAPPFATEAGAGVTTFLTTVQRSGREMVERFTPARRTAAPEQAIAPADTPAASIVAGEPVDPAEVATTTSPQQPMSTVRVPPAEVPAAPGPVPGTRGAAATRRESRADTNAGVTSYVSFAESVVRVGERTSVAAVGVNRLQSLTGRTSVRWRAVSGSARAGQDFEATGGTLDFPEGHDFRMLYVPLINDDVAEEDERFMVEFFEPSVRTQIGPLARMEVVIVDDD